MTVNQHYPLPQYGTASNADIDDDDATSPSDGYFGQRSSVPDTVFIPNPEAQPDAKSMDKSKEAAAARQPIYTPATTATPAASSRRDSGSTHNGSRYNGGAPERDLLDDDPPPMYSDTPTDWSQSQNHSQHAPSVRDGQTQYRDAPAPTRVRQSNPPSSHASISTRSINSNASPRPMAQSMADHPVDLTTIPEDESPLLPVAHGGRPKRHGGCCAKRRQRKERKRHLRGWFAFAVGALILVWLIVHLVKIINHAHAGTRIPDTNFPPNTNTSKPIPVPSRSYRQHETSTSISGSYDLYDLLELSSTSGSISVTVVPQPPGPDNAPAVLNIRTISGSINVRFAPSAYSTPDRLYQTTLSSQSGGVNGNLLINGAGAGGSASISTRSGSISMTFHPFLSPNATQYNGPATLSTTSNSGSQTLNIKSPVSQSPGSELKLSDLAATHSSNGSGSLNLKYPREWRGIVHAKSLGSGSVNARGDGLHFQQRGSREVYAWRGKEGEEVETVEIRGVGSGSVDFRC